MYMYLHRVVDWFLQPFIVWQPAPSYKTSTYTCSFLLFISVFIHTPPVFEIFDNLHSLINLYTRNFIVLQSSSSVSLVVDGLPATILIWLFYSTF